MESNRFHAHRGETEPLMEVGSRTASRMEVTAESTVLMKQETLEHILSMAGEKGDVFMVSRVAGMMAAKRAHELLPMCRSADIEELRLTVTPVPPDAVHILATALSLGRTGVEMAAMTAVSVSALTVFDLCRNLDPDMEISATRIVRKGRRPPYVRL